MTDRDLLAGVTAELVSEPQIDSEDIAASGQPLRDTCSPAGWEAGKDPPDADLLRMHLQGDPDAFRALFRRHKQDLWAVAIAMLGDAEPAADAIQDAMIFGFRNAPDFRSGNAVMTWLYRIVVDVCLDRMRHGATDTGSGEAMVAMRHLLAEQQAALVLVDMLSFSTADASSVLGIAESTLQSRCGTARARLVAELMQRRRARSSKLPRQ
jgi:RNA polymerase sigma-70 factor, ECF subfamily